MSLRTMITPTTTCVICDETFNAKNFKPVECMHCNYKACRTCCENFLTTKVTICCMNTLCKQEWTQKFLVSELTKNFLQGPFRRHRENIYYETEKALLPETQGTVEKIVEYERQIQELEQNVHKITTYIRTCIEVFLKYADSAKHAMAFYYEGHKIKDEVRLKEALVKDMKILRVMRKFMICHKTATWEDKKIFTDHYDLIINEREIDAEIKQFKSQIVNAYKNGYVATHNDPHKFIKPCPLNECRGFLSTKWECGLCHGKVCSKCHVPKNDETVHTCHADDLATAELLMKDTKHCPQCAIPIHKIEGCDQMWCVQCKTAFSWATGEIVNGGIHNPHYYEWLRQQNQVERNPLEIICGREIDNQFVYSLFAYVRIRGGDVQKLNIETMCSNFLYFKEQVTHFPVYDIMNNRKHRIAFLKQEIDEATFKKHIFIRQKHNDMNREIRLWLLLFRDVGTELFFNFYEKLQDLNQKLDEPLEEMKREFLSVQELVTRNLEEICRLFHIKVRTLDIMSPQHADWNIKPVA